MGSPANVYEYESKTNELPFITARWSRLDDLPPEVMLHIFEQLPMKDLISFRGVCKYFRDTVSPTVFRMFQLRLTRSDLWHTHRWYPVKRHTYCRDHGYYEGSDQPCKPPADYRDDKGKRIKPPYPSKSNCGYHASNVASFEKSDGVRLDALSANLKRIVGEYRSKAPFFYAQELFVHFTSGWENYVSSSKTLDFHDGFSKHVLPNMLSAMPNLRSVHILGEPFGYRQPSSPFSKYLLPTLCHICSQRGVEVHATLKGNASHARPVEIVRALSGLSSLSLLVWLEQMGTNFVPAVVKLLERSPRLELQSSQTRAGLKQVDQFMGHQLWMCQLGPSQYEWIRRYHGKESVYLEGLSSK